MITITTLFENTAADGPLEAGMGPVSYTHLDVYKRQASGLLTTRPAARWTRRGLR